jgi:hypothetical protein
VCHHRTRIGAEGVRHHAVSGVSGRGLPGRRVTRVLLLYLLYLHGGGVKEGWDSSAMDPPCGLLTCGGMRLNTEAAASRPEAGAMRFEGKPAGVTWGGSGMGRGIAPCLGTEGAGLVEACGVRDRLALR